MRTTRVAPAVSSLYFVRGISVSQSEAATAALIGILFIALVITFFAPSVGVTAMEIGFPILAAGILLQKSNDRFAPTILFPAVYLGWYWMGNMPLLTDDRHAALRSNSADQVWLYCLLGLFAYFCGTFLVRADGIEPAMLRGVRQRWEERPMLFSLAVLASAIFLAWASITATEGIPIFKASVDTFRLEIPGRHRAAYQILIAFSTVMLPLTFLYLWTAPVPRFRRSLLAFSAFIVFIFVSLGSRGLVLPAALTLFALRHYLRKPWPIRYILIAGFILLPLLSVSGYYRSLQHYGPTYVRDLIDLGLPVQLQPFTNIYLYIRAPIETFRNVVQVIPAVSPFQHGGVSLGFLAQVLPGRHPSSDYFFKEVLGHPSDGFGEPAGILGTFYADFGAVGIFAAMFFTGLINKAIYVHMYRGSLGWLLVYCFLWQKLIGSLYGSLFTYIVELAVPLIWVVAVSILSDGAPFRANASRPI